MLPTLPEETATERGRRVKHDLPLQWQTYWDKAHDVDVPERCGVFRVYESGKPNAPQILLIHGGGYSALTWSLIASRLKQRGRGRPVCTRAPLPRIELLREKGVLQTLTEDVVSVWGIIQKRNPSLESPLVLVGHSLGAAIAVRAAATGRMASLQGIVVIDVVEGTALASLPYMKTVLNKRPESFSCLESAVEWALVTKMCKNEESACVSVPSMLTPSDDKWIWRTALLPTEKYWVGWYDGLSELFLSLSVPKLLCLAGSDRLDRTLIVGQMQGRFQLELMPLAGHAIHEDDPDHVADLFGKFVNKFRIGQAPLPFFRN